MNDGRYQNQNVLVKTYRWLRWKPLYFVISLYKGFHCPKDIKPEDIRSIYMGLADVKMNHVYTMDETFDRLGRK